MNLKGEYFKANSILALKNYNARRMPKFTTFDIGYDISIRMPLCAK